MNSNASLLSLMVAAPLSVVPLAPAAYELNRAVSTIIIATMTTVSRVWPTRVGINFQGKTGEVVLGQIRAVDKSRLVKRLGKLDSATASAVLDCLRRIVRTMNRSAGLQPGVINLPFPVRFSRRRLLLGE